MKTKSLLISTLAFTALCAGALFAAETPHAGSPAPGFALTDSNGQKHSLGEYRGKYVVLEWFNPGCPFVQKHYKSENMQKLQKEFTGKGVVWLTIDSSAAGEEGNLSPAEANKQMTEWKMNSTAFLLDASGKVGHEYGATNTPHLYVINPKGDLIYTGAIDNKPTAQLADVPGATNYVRAALDAAMAGQPVASPTTKAYGCSVKYAR